MPITINPASRISASQWVAMFKRSPHVPRALKDNLSVSGNVITGPRRMAQPADQVPKDWPNDLVAAFTSQDWEVTTAVETYVVEKDATGFHVQRRFAIDLQSGEFGPGTWMKSGPGQRLWSPQNLGSRHKVGDRVAVEFGETFEGDARLRSGRHLVIVVDRITVYGVKPSALFSSWFKPFSRYVETSRTFTTPETRLLSTFMHEIAVHAGRIVQKKTADHGNLVVDMGVEDIEALFPPDQLLDSVAAAVHEAEARLRDLEASVKAGRTLTPSGSTVTGARAPGPVGL